MGERQTTGGCLCGEIRFKLSGTPHLIEYCHCNSCRKAVGAPVVAWAGVALDEFEIIEGNPGRYTSSPGVERTFCKRCGTSLTQFADEFPDEIYVSISILDNPTAMAPDTHIWRLDRLPWFETADDFPRYLRFKSDGIVEQM